MAVCMNCGKSKPGVAMALVTSPVGLAAWNLLHPDDQRVMLLVCDDECAYQLGLKCGREMVARGLP